jgi:23S rRNA (adenine2503-C2)-methyltransferase
MHLVSAQPLLQDAFDPLAANRSEWQAWCKAHGLPAFRGTQIFQGLHRQAVATWDAIKGLPKDAIARLEAAFPRAFPTEITREESRDGTVKSLLELADGKRVEAVSIPTSDRHTVCVSSQVGCAVGCTFCASGLTGVDRDLQAGEIIAQVLHHHRHRPVTNLVYMGSGEPLFNYDRVLRSIRTLADTEGLGLGRRRFTVSTSGVAPKIRQLAEDEPQITLALSLHAPDDTTRHQLVPLNRRWSVAELLRAMDDYARKVNRRITLEYCLLRDANMSPDQAQLLAQLARRYGAHINLIPFNPVIETPHQRPSWDDVEAFAAQVEAAGGHCTVRGQRGADINAACGQLKRKQEQLEIDS